MDGETIEKRYLGTVKLFGHITGLWPFFNKLHQNVVQSFMAFILISAGFSQIGKIAFDYSTEVLLLVIPYCVILSNSSTKGINSRINSERFKALIEGMQNDWKAEKTVVETRIMLTYADRGLLYSKLYTGNIMLTVFVFICLPTLPPLLDTFLPLNETRPRLYIYPGYYYLNEDDYYLLIVFNQMIVVNLIACLFIYSDGTWIIIVQHTCGLFEIAGHQLKHAIDVSTDRTTTISEEEIYQRVAKSIKSHKRALEFRNEVEGCHVWAIFLETLPQVLAISATMVQLVTMKHSVEMFTYIGFIIAQLIHLLFHTIQGQFVESHAENVYKLTYEAKWYDASPRIQSLFVLVLRKCLEPTMLTAGRIMPLNLETFTVIMKSTMSYYTLFSGN